MDSQKLFLENLDKNGLLMQKKDINFNNNANNFFASASGMTPFGNLTNIKSNSQVSNCNTDIPEDNSKTFNGLDTDMLSKSKFKKIDDSLLKLKLKITKLKIDLEEHKKLVESSFLKSDKNHYQKLLEIQHRMENEIQRLVTEYQNRQLQSIVFAPFVKLVNSIKSYIALR